MPKYNFINFTDKTVASYISSGHYKNGQRTKMASSQNVLMLFSIHRENKRHKYLFVRQLECRKCRDISILFCWSICQNL